MTQTSITLTACADGGKHVTATKPKDGSDSTGHLSCKWRQAPPPRVGARLDVDGSDDIDQMCRLAEMTTFIAPQYKNAGDPYREVAIEGPDPAEEQCCRQCTLDSACRAWTLTGDYDGDWDTCHLVTTATNAYPDTHALSGFPIRSDPGSYCPESSWGDSGGSPPPVGDQTGADGISCGWMPALLHPPRSGPNFPAAWNASYGPTQPSDQDRGQAWFFFPSLKGDKPCKCKCDDPYGCPDMTCKGPAMDDAALKKHVKGKPWIVFVHGGHFHDWNALGAQYAFLSTKVAAAAGMGVLAIDMRTLAADPPAGFPDQLDDVVTALQWLRAQGATDLHLYGDSSGSSIVVQTLLYIPWRRRQGRDPGVNVTAAIAFSAWLDMTSSGPTFDSRRACDGKCNNIGAMSDQMIGPSTRNRLLNMCEARPFAGALPINHPIVSPSQAPPSMLADIPPLRLVIGGAEALLGENFAFAQRAAAAGASVQVDVYEAMWHDFVQYTDGCGADTKLLEGTLAIEDAGKWLKKKRWARVSCEGGKDCLTSDDGRGRMEAAAPIRWHFRYNDLPPPTGADCEGVYGCPGFGCPPDPRAPRRRPARAK